MSRPSSFHLSNFFLAPLFLLYFASQASAQLDFGKKFSLEGYGVDEANLAAQEGALYWGRVKLDYNRPLLDVPFDPTREWGVFWGLEADYTRFDFNGNLQGFEDLDLYRMRLPWQVAYKPGGMRSDWLFAAMLAPGFASDLGGFELDDLTLDALLIGLYKINEQWEIGAGLYYSNNLALPFPVPSLGVNWTPSKDFTLRAFPPILSAQWQWREHWASELFLRPAGGLWNLHEEHLEGAESFKLSAWMAGVGLEHELSDSSQFQLSAGVLFGQRVEFRDQDGDKLLGSDVDPALFVRAGYQWNF